MGTRRVYAGFSLVADNRCYCGCSLPRHMMQGQDPCAQMLAAIWSAKASRSASLSFEISSNAGSGQGPGVHRPCPASS
jgi:hypothetical protein